ncbi:putative mucin/carbohydrate-binding domain-containing protein [Bacillus mycoides]|uniref:putative mucin/carbohydrate-binding domain-containing protein n=1 Tax=Bacillus mycoides TaxID=1405 RepID=UPI003D1B730E
MSKKNKSRVLVAGICISTLLSPVAFEASKGYAAPLEENKGGKLEESKENRLEQRTFHVSGKGDVTKERDRLKVNWELAANEPTGIYAKPNEEIKIEIKGDKSIKAFIGTHAYDEEKPKEFELKPGDNVISSPMGGILYFYNSNNQGEVTAEVTNGGSHFPLFILGKHTKKDWDEMLEKYENPYAVELRGERSLITSSYDAVQDYMENTDPTELLKLHDKIIRIENEVSGLSEESVGVAKAPKHYVQFVENRYPDEGDWMNAYYYRTSYIKTAMEYVLDIEKLKTDGWGPWHEVGHLHQQAPWDWSAVGEVTVNIYALAVQKALGNKLGMDDHYKKTAEYLKKPMAERILDDADPVTLFWQLHVVYGEHFYPKLHQMYRILPNTEMPGTDEEKKQMFIYMTSKAAGQNLIPFFKEWGLAPTDDIRKKIENLKLPKLEKEIWKATDSNDIREKQVEAYKVPYGEPTNVMQDILAGTDFDKKKASSLVQNLGENVKVTGKIIGSKLEPGEQEVLVEIEDDKGNKNLIPVSVNAVYADSMVFGSYFGKNINSILTLNHDTKKISASLLNEILHHSYSGEKYIGFTIYDEHGKEKKSVSAEGQESLEVFVKELNGIKFEYGDVIKVYHREPEYFTWYQNNKLVDQGNYEEQEEKVFKITPQGFELKDSFQEVKEIPQKVVVGTDVEKLDAKKFVEVTGGEVIGFVEKPNTTKIGEQKVKVETKDRFGNKKVTEVSVEIIFGDSIMFFGTSYGGSNIKSVVTLNHEEKKFSTTDSEGPMHTSFADEKYMGMTVYDKDGKEKKTLSVKASENTKGFAEQFNGMTFEYGDMLKVYQKEFDRFKVYKKNELVDTQYGVHEVFFKVTEQGFERMEAMQEVTAVPQKVTIGTDAEKLEAKDFVQVKDGEVIGFIEKPNTTKIGEQKVKVETKDRFGTKKVTEVPVEVIYGDSIMFFGTSYGGSNIKSVVTLNHEEKKFSTTDSEGPMHTSFADEKYMEMTVYDKAGKEKKAVSVKASENTKAFAEQFNGMTFEYGDVVKVYQREFDRFKVYKKNEFVDTEYGVHEVFFKVTEQGFERIATQQEVTAVPQKVVIGTGAEKLNAKDFVQVKDGEVIGFVEKPNTTKIGEQKVKVETKDHFGNKKVTEVSLEVTYGDSLVFKGIEYTGDGDIKSVVTLQHDKKKFSATDHHNKAHGNFKEETYFEFALLDATGKEKKKATVKGVENTKEFAKAINGLGFEYGDVVKVYHAESDRFNWYQNSTFAGQGKAKVEKELFFKVTEKGFERMETLQEVTAKPQQVVVGTDVEKLDAKNFVQVKDGEVVGFVEKPNTTKIGEQKVKVETKDRFGNKKVTEVSLEVIYGDSIMFFGTWYGGTNIKSIITLNHEDRKLSTVGSEGPVHTQFKGEKYMGLTVLDKDGKEKKQMVLEGMENTKAFAEQFNGIQFEYGDVVKVYQAEFDRFKVYKNNTLVNTTYGMNDVFFKITEKGFERMEGMQEVKA